MDPLGPPPSPIPHETGFPELVSLLQMFQEELRGLTADVALVRIDVQRQQDQINHLASKDEVSIRLGHDDARLVAMEGTIRMLRATLDAHSLRWRKEDDAERKRQERLAEELERAESGFFGFVASAVRGLMNDAMSGMRWRTWLLWLALAVALWLAASALLQHPTVRGARPPATTSHH